MKHVFFLPLLLFFYLYLPTKQIMQPLNNKKSRNLSTNKKHCKNRKTLPWEHHIGCQMCQIALSQKTDKVKKKIIACMIFLTTVTTVTAVTKFFLPSHYFWKKLLDTFDNRYDFLRTAFCDSHYVFSFLFFLFFFFFFSSSMYIQISFYLLTFIYLLLLILSKHFKSFNGSL